MRHRWLVYLNILENRTKIITKINKIARIPLFFRIWSKLAAHLHLHMHVKKILSSNSQMYVLYSIQFLSCVWNHPKRDRSLEIHERWKKNLLRKKKMHDDKKKLLVSDNLLFFENYFFLHRHVFTFFANQQLKNIHSQLMSTNKDISYTWINSQTNATSGYTNGQFDIIMANFKNNPVLSQFYSWMNHPCIPSFTCFIM